jgi:hypothetical protein
VRPGSITSLAVAVAALCIAHCDGDSWKSRAEEPGLDSDLSEVTGTDNVHVRELGPGVAPGVARSCPREPLADCSKTRPELGKYKAILDQTQLGPETSFIGIAGDPPLLLAQWTSGDETEPVVFAADWSAGPPDEQDLVAAWPSAPVSAGSRPVGLAAGAIIFDRGDGFRHASSALGYGALVLLCSDQDCEIHGLVAEEYGASASLVPMPGGEVPIPDVAGMIGVASEATRDDLARVCVFGDGLACFDGASWTVHIAPRSGAVLRAATVVFSGSSWSVIAVGDSGRIVSETPSGWIGEPSGTAADLRSIFADGGFFAAGGADVLLLGNQDGSLACPVTGPEIRALFADSRAVSDRPRREITTILSDGEVVEVVDDADGVRSCAFPERLRGSPLGIQLWVRNASAYDTLVMTDTTIYDRVQGKGTE